MTNNHLNGSTKTPVASMTSGFSMLNFLDKLEPNPKEKNKYICPVCGGNDLSVHPESGAYQCFSNGCDTADIRNAVAPAEKRKGSARERKPRKKTHTELRREVQAVSVERESRVDELVRMVEGGYHTIGQAKIELKAWAESNKLDLQATKVLLDLFTERVTTTQKCRLAATYESVAEVLEGRLAFNKLKRQLELDGEPTNVDDLRINMALRYNLQVSQADCGPILYHIAQKTAYSPVAHYLDQAASQHGPDDALLDNLAETFLGTASPLHRVYLRKTLISAVARAMQPGCKVDTVCILNGPQGWGKSSFWRILAGEPWFDDTMGSGSEKDERLKLHKFWLIEWAELEAVFRRRDISAVKAFITCQTDHVRRPYGKDEEELPRPSIIVGTTNMSEFLADTTGNRRFWVVPLCRPVPLQQLALDRDRIWAAAVHAYRSGEQWTLPPELQSIAEEDVAAYGTTDPWEDFVMDYATPLEQTTIKEVMTAALKLDIDKMDKRAEMRVASILQANGWARKLTYVEGRRIRVWQKSQKFDPKGGSSGSTNPEKPLYQEICSMEPPLEGGGSGSSVHGTMEPLEPPLSIEGNNSIYSNGNSSSHLSESMVTAAGDLTPEEVAITCQLLSEVTSAADLELLTDLTPTDKAHVWASLSPEERTRLQSLRQSS